MRWWGASASIRSLAKAPPPSITRCAAAAPRRTSPSATARTGAPASRTARRGGHEAVTRPSYCARRGIHPRINPMKLVTAALVVGATALAAPVHAQLVKIDGSSTVFPVTEAVAEDFQKAK